LEHWNAPEDYPAAVCVPVSTPTTVLGTLWFFAESARDFSEKQSTTAEIVAGRLAADLEREMLMLESVQHKKWERDFSHLVEQQQRRLPNITPVMDNWQVANWYHPADDATGEFYDWFVLPDSRFGVVVGKANGDGLESVLTAMTLQSAIKSHSVYAHSCDQMLNRVSETLWSSSQGDQFASMFYTLIDPEEGRLEYSGAGRVGAVICRSGTPEILRVEPSSLGEDIDVEYASFQASLVPGDVLVLFTDGLRDALETPENVTAEEKIASVLAAQNNASAEAIIDRIQDLVETYASARALTDRTAIVIRRD